MARAVIYYHANLLLLRNSKTLKCKRTAGEAEECDSDPFSIRDTPNCGQRLIIVFNDGTTN